MCIYIAHCHKVSNALGTLVPAEKPSFQNLSEGLIVLLCTKVVRQGVSDHEAVHSKCSSANSRHPMSWHHHQLLCGWPETLPTDRCATICEVLWSLAMPTFLCILLQLTVVFCGSFNINVIMILLECFISPLSLWTERNVYHRNEV